MNQFFKICTLQEVEKNFHDIAQVNADQENDHNEGKLIRNSLNKILDIK